MPARVLVVLLLFALFPRPAAGAVAFGSVEEFHQWVTYYYVEPTPERVEEAVRFMEKEGLLAKPTAVQPLVSFLGHIFRKNPDRIGPWVEEFDYLPEGRKVIWQAAWFSGTPEGQKALKEAEPRLPEEDKKYLAALTLLPAPDLLTLPIDSPAVLDMLWAGFQATGDEAYVFRVIGALAAPAQEQENEGLDQVIVREAARWSLASVARQHPKVMQICRRALPKQPEEVRKALEEVIKQ